MSIKSKAFAVAAALAVVGGVGTAGTVSAAAATPSCGHNCIDVFSRQFGTHHQPNYVLDVWRQGANVGQPIILFRSSNSDPAQDFNISDQGTVQDFRDADLVSAAVNKHYSDQAAFELEYAPYGVNSGLCVGLATTAHPGEHVSLQPCGVSGKTVWILDMFDKSFPAFLHHYYPLINGSDRNFSHPFVLTYPSNGFPTDRPRPQLLVRNLTGFTHHHGHGTFPVIGTVLDTQLWGADFGILR